MNGNKKSNLLRYVTVILVIIAIAGPWLAYSAGSQAAPKEAQGLTGTVKIGSLLPLTGKQSKSGKEWTAAEEVACEQVNEFLDTIGAGWNLEIVRMDTRREPNLAMEKIHALNAKGIKIVVGSASSGEIRNIMNYVNERDMFLYGISGSPALRQDDLIFRSYDSTIGGLSAAYTMYEEGVRHVVGVLMANEWHKGNMNVAEKKFEELGGEYVERITYSPETLEFGPVVSKIESAVKDAIEKYGAEKVGVHLQVWEEFVNMVPKLQEVNASEWGVKWYDGNTIPGNPTFIKDTATREFLSKTEAIGFMFDYPPRSAPRVKELMKKVEEKVGFEPSNWARHVYDEVWLTAMTLLTTDSYNAHKIAAAMPRVTKNYHGACGDLRVNEFGDWVVSRFKGQSLLKVDENYKYKTVVAGKTTGEVNWTHPELPR